MSETPDGGDERSLMVKTNAALDTVTEALEQLNKAAIAEEAVDTVLLRVAETALAALVDSDAVSVTRFDTTAPCTVASTDKTLAALDARQYAAGRGPCLRAARSQLPVRAVVGEHAEAWPEFTATAHTMGVRAYLSVPLLVDVDQKRRLIGSFNAYSFRAEAFDPLDQRLMTLLTAAAATAISNGWRWQNARDHIEQMKLALTSRAEIDQAKGVLMALHGIDGEEAFRRLAHISQHTNTKLHDVARDLLRSCTGNL
jgi:hypothetical protein